MSMAKKLQAIVLAAVMLLTGTSITLESTDAASKSPNTEKKPIVSSGKEMRGIWLAYCDFKSLGMDTDSKSTYKKNVTKVISKAKSNGCNAIFFHVRAFDDAAWKSKTFKASEYLTNRSTSGRTAYKTYAYDPLKELIKIADKYNLEVHAYMNPYRITFSKFLNPASTYSTKRINKAVTELKAYKLDGIHFDDYFYHSSSKYVTPSKSTWAKTTVKGSTFKKTPSAKKKRKYVNKMLKSIHTTVKKQGRAFGVSPQGNYQNCMSSGADVKSWLKSKTYVDYVAPQIYWTDQWGKKGKTKMYTNRLNTYVKLWKKKSVRLYIGLALYRTGKKASDDQGWKKSNTNLKTQVKKLRKKGAKGYILFSANDLDDKHAAKELKNLKNFVK